MYVSVILGRKGHSVETIQTTATLLDATRQMAKAQVSALVVSDDGAHVDGMISDRDVVRRIGAAGPTALDTAVGDAMTRQVITCRPDDRIVSIMNIMTQERIRHIPVVDGDDARLAGLVSIGDAVKNRLDEIQMEAESLRDYITRTH